jgi:hypothetical protein
MGTNSEESHGEIGDSGMSADSKDNIEKGSSSESENESDKLHEADDDDDDDDYDSKRDHDNGSGSNKSDKENENFGDKNIARKFGSRWSSRLAGVASHPALEAGNLCKKSRRLRQRPTRNSALDSNNVLDSDDETLSKHANREISGHEDSPPVSNSDVVCCDS